MQDEYSLEEIPEHFDRSGWQDWCVTCGDRTNNVRKYCLLYAIIVNRTINVIKGLVIV